MLACLIPDAVAGLVHMCPQRFKKLGLAVTSFHDVIWACTYAQRKGYMVLAGQYDQPVGIQVIS